MLEPYDQDYWVSVQKHQDSSWKNMIQLWSFFNLHFGNFIARIPDEVILAKHQEHNLDKYMMNPLAKSNPATLNYLIRDYMYHLEHHVGQILPSYIPTQSKTYAP
jgi:hypothetical protein